MSESTIPYATPAQGTTAATAGRDLFGVAVRTVGLLLILWGVYAAANAVIWEVFGGGRPADQPKEGFVVFAVLWPVLGIALLKGEWLVRLAYGPPRP